MRQISSDSGGAGPSIAETVRRRVAQFRHKREWSQAQLADRLAALGAGVLSRAAVSKIESGARQVTAEEAIWIAIALGVSPLDLLIPANEPEVSIAPDLRVAPGWVLRWARGFTPLGPSSWDWDSDKNRRFYDEARPDSEAGALREVPQLRTIRETADRLMWRVASLGLDRPDAIPPLIDDLGIIARAADNAKRQLASHGRRLETGPDATRKRREAEDAITTTKVAIVEAKARAVSTPTTTTATTPKRKESKK